ncbi:riboflavin synthase [Thiomicrorhabdus sediminis]|uniref:Riboflavin synthase n=1 Tax=Thiomicrorhabdus sediminis TaxID=2580412 RepID=A0A4P9K7S0_9GAMM|nr:riboflavin synthase [Thiomicrorhabdus sediminis]QCU90406.1 riboflavin synthase [Thiomicrorhabdus sediminis]
MFTGIIQAEGRIAKVEPTGGDFKMTIEVGKLDMSDVQIGDSIAANGVCLTVIEFGASFYIADVSVETIQVTNADNWEVGAAVNLEKALRLQDRLGGHLVSGHVDGIGKVVEIKQDARSWRYQLEAPIELCKYIAAKGSICINGISLTVNQVEKCRFDVNIVPHTRQETTMKYLAVGSQVNLEVDLLARYLERMLSAPQAQQASKITPEFLAEHGFS